VLVAGQREFETRQERLAHGIPLHASVVGLLRRLAEETGVPMPEALGRATKRRYAIHTPRRCWRPGDTTRWPNSAAMGSWAEGPSISQNPLNIAPHTWGSSPRRPEAAPGLSPCRRGGLGAVVAGDVRIALVAAPHVVVEGRSHVLAAGVAGTVHTTPQIDAFHCLPARCPEAQDGGRTSWCWAKAPTLVPAPAPLGWRISRGTSISSLNRPKGHLAEETVLA